MDATAALESIAGLLATMPDESVEDLLVTFDSLVNVSDAGARPVAAGMLRRAAESATNPTRHDRLLQAAAAVETGQPCALTPDGLTAQQAAAAQTITQEEWDKRQAETPLPPPPGEAVDDEADEDEDEDVEDSADSYMEEPPPALPHIPVRHFFSGLLVRVGKDFGDGFGRAVCSGDLLKVLACNPNEDGFSVMFLQPTVVLSTKVPGHDAIIENAGNAWFQPVATSECIDDLVDAIETSMAEAESEDDSDDDDWTDRLETLREQIDECKVWLSHPRRTPVPADRDGKLAAKLFGKDHALACLVPLFFACVEVFDRFLPDSTPYEMERRDPMMYAANQSPAFRKFISSMTIDYSDWREGVGYDLDALRDIAKSERVAAVELLSQHLDVTPNWRDIEALEAIDTSASRAAIHRAMAHADPETRLHAAEALADLGEKIDLEAVIIETLRTTDLYHGLSKAIDMAAEHPSPRMQEALLDLALNGDNEQRVHCAALALYLGGKADEPFDWNHRPFFLQFGEENRETRLAAHKELRRRLGHA